MTSRFILFAFAALAATASAAYAETVRVGPDPCPAPAAAVAYRPADSVAAEGGEEDEVIYRSLFIFFDAKAPGARHRGPVPRVLLDPETGLPVGAVSARPECGAD